ncbi:MAG: hypothetical protein ABJI69_00145 [Balneola sp.]
MKQFAIDIFRKPTGEFVAGVYDVENDEALFHSEKTRKAAVEFLQTNFKPGSKSQVYVDHAFDLMPLVERLKKQKHSILKRQVGSGICPYLGKLERKWNLWLNNF